MIMFKPDYSKRKIHFYAVSEKGAEKNKLYTITSSIKDAREYAMNIVKGKHFQHYSSWCKFKNLDPKDDSAWLQYFNTCVDPSEAESLIIFKLSYKHSQLSGILRMFAGCMPLNCSFEYEKEVEKYENDYKIQETSVKLQKENDLLKQKIDELNKKVNELSMEKAKNINDSIINSLQNDEISDKEI